MSDTLGIIVVLAIIIGPLVYVTVRDRKRNQLTREQLTFPSPPEETLDTVVEYLMRQGLSITHQGSRSATLSRPGAGPNMLAGIALLLLGIVPGILYLILRRPRPVYTTVAARPLGNGTSEITLSGDDPRMQEAIIHWWKR